MNEDDPKTVKPLCLTCGLCCDGTIFARVPLKPEDSLAPLETADFEIRIKITKKRPEPRKSFSLPCVAFQENCCQIYNDRPTTCRKYRCDLLKKYEDGKIVWESAQTKISRASHLREIVKIESEKVLPGSAKLSVPALQKLLPSQEQIVSDLEMSKKWGAMLLNLSALLDCLYANFLSPSNIINSSEKPFDTEV